MSGNGIAISLNKGLPFRQSFVSGSLWIALGLLVGFIWLELIVPKQIQEGFQWLENKSSTNTPIQPQPSSILTNPFSKRGDIGPTKEESGYKSDKRYFSDYADVQAIGVQNDFCRMVYPEGGQEEDSFFACALAGTSGLTSIDYKTKTVKDGFKRSRDDYMKSLLNRDAYCRIIKYKNDFIPMCLPAEDFGFGHKDYQDTDPPKEISTLVEFYRGCRMWLRFRDDMNDYIEKAMIQVAGGASVEESPPRPAVTRGLTLNGNNQFIRLGDSSDLSFGNLGSFRSVRAFSVWVKFDEFTNNAHIFDFGNGAGRDNVFLGILGKGDADSSSGNSVRPNSQCPETTLPEPSHQSGAQWCPEVRADELLKNSPGNVDDFTCPGADIYADPKRARPINTRPEKDDPNATRSKATLLYEVWDSRVRKMQIKINKIIPLGKWTHITISATSMDAVRPDIKIYVNGLGVYSFESGFLPQSAVTEKNYLGKSNWTDQPGEYELRDELLRGAIFDFRMYNIVLTQTGIHNIVQWGSDMLGLNI
jgi:hypothetical protein